jgi:hypothetical protein
MPCREWSWLVFQYCSSVLMYSKAARSLGDASGAGFDEAWGESEDARKASAALRAALLEHEHRRGCQMVPGHQKGARVDPAGFRRSLCV